ncbi:MAG: hypothetical protein KKA73_22705 [Chloroflexi bacterium]|nr:hypothetical protein [Chloroflexota bacterium]
MKNKIKYLIVVVGILLVVGTILLPGVTARPNLELGAQARNGKGFLGPSSTLFSYQGQLLDVNDDPVNSSVEMTFHFYHDQDPETGDQPFWTEAHSGAQAIIVTDGLFHVLLGSLVPINQADLTGDVYLELVVGGETLAPRELLTSVAFAVEAGTLPDGAETQGSLNVCGVLGLQAHDLIDVDDISSGNPDGGGWHAQNFQITNGQGNIRIRTTDNLFFFIDSNNDTADAVFRVLKDNDSLNAPVAEIFAVSESGNVTASGNLTLKGDLLHIHSDADTTTSQIKFQNNDFITYDDGTISPGSFSLDADGNAANAFLLAGGAYLNTGYDSSYRLKTNGNAYIGGNLSVAGIHTPFNIVTERAWQFKQMGSGSTADTALHSTVDDKRFVFTNQDDSVIMSIKADNDTGGSLSVGQPGAHEGGEITLQKGSSGSYWTLDNYFGDFRLHHDGKVYLTVKKSIGPGLEIWPGYKDNQPNSEWVTLDMPGTRNLRIWDNLSVSGSMQLEGPCITGAFIEANLQTQKEKEAGRIDRFEEGDVLCWGMDQLELCSCANDRLVQAVADPQGRPIVLGAEVIKVIGPVQRGDILVTSNVPGYAMVNNNPVPGSVIAQALEDFDGDRGLIKAMIRKW